MHHLTSKSADSLSTDYHRLAEEAASNEARAAFLHAAALLNRARLSDFAASSENFFQEYQCVPVSHCPACGGSTKHGFRGHCSFACYSKRYSERTRQIAAVITSSPLFLED